MNFKKLDKRMTGHVYFQYRVEFWLKDFVEFFPDTPGYFNVPAYKLKIKAFTSACDYLTKHYGFGAPVDYMHHLASDSYKPTWAVKHTDSRHEDAIYVATEDLKDELVQVINDIIQSNQ